MRKGLALLAAVLLLASSCSPAESADLPAAPGDTPASSVPAGTAWNAVDEFGGSMTGVWQYAYAVQTDAPLAWTRLETYSEDGESRYWKTADEPVVSVGETVYVPGWLEITASGSLGRMAGLQFVAPADGTYTLSGTLHNEWGEAPDGMTVAHGEREILRQALTGTDTTVAKTVTMKKGETLTVYSRAAGNGVSHALYWQVSITKED